MAGQRRAGSGRRRARRGAFALGSLCVVALAVPALGAEDDLVLVSRATGPAGAQGDLDSERSSIAADGSVVAFASEANNLSTDDDDTVGNVFVRNLGTDTTTLVSRATGVAGAGGTSASAEPAISDDGRYVAFQSTANNLSADDDDVFSNIFVRDLATGTTTLVSRATGPGGAAANGSSAGADISSDGRYVVFQSAAANLSSEDVDGLTNVFVRDLAANTTTLVSRRGRRGPGAAADAVNPSISGDGNRVAFSSDADNLSGEDDNSAVNIFVRDIAAGTTTLASRATGVGGAAANDGSTLPDISPSGRFVAFRSSADNLSAEDDNAFDNVFLRDLDGSTTVLVSRATGPGGAAADGASTTPVVSDNARVAFQSAARNLSDADGDAVPDIFVRDALADTTELVSRASGPTGAGADQSAVSAATSRDGRFVTFTSFAGNLVVGVTGGKFQVYRRDVLGDAPVATPICKAVPLPDEPSDEPATFTLTVSQLTINQRISQAAIRRLNAVESRLDGGLAGRDLCGYSVGPGSLGPGITSAPAASSLAPGTPANPAPIVDPGRTGTGDPLTLSAAQLLINQRIDQAAIRRATGIGNRLDDGLTGGDLKDGAVTQGTLFDRLQILSKTPGTEPAASQTVIPARRNPPNPGSVTLSVEQLRINQRIAQAGVRNANALIRRLETGLTGEDLRAATLTARDLG